ncbi:MAG TPA: hypothetical protein PLO67_22530 [Saprospiraceae bacterium]|nr:hypothetical protein [Saprospiraceae bacterium]
MSSKKQYFGLLFLYLFMAADAATAQETRHPRGAYARLGLGYAPVISAPRFSTLIDPLLSLPDDNNSVLYEVQWQSRRHWGFFFQFSFINISASIRKTFTEQLERDFPNDYVLEEIKDVPEPYSHGESPVQGLIGGSYAFDAGKWSLQPRIMFGGTTFNPLSVDVALKRRNSNQLSILSVKPTNTLEDGSVSAFTFGLGTLVQWHLWRRWSIFGMAEWTTFKPDLLYSYRLVNQVDGSETIQTFGSSDTRFAHVIHAGAGLTFRITRK